MNHFSAHALLRHFDLRAESCLAATMDPRTLQEGCRVSSWGKTKVTQCHLVGCKITAAAPSTRDHCSLCQRQKLLALRVGQTQSNFWTSRGIQPFYHSDTQEALEPLPAVIRGRQTYNLDKHQFKRLPKVTNQYILFSSNFCGRVPQGEIITMDGR